MPQAIKTLDDVILREDRYDINKVTLFKQTEDGELVIPDKNIFRTYLRFIRPYVTELKVSDHARQFYRFRPQLLSLDIYGTPSLDWMLMMLNDRECASKFYLKDTVKIIPSNIIGKVFQEVIARPAGQLQKNRDKYIRLIGEDIVIR